MSGGLDCRATSLTRQSDGPDYAPWQADIATGSDLGSLPRFPPRGLVRAGEPLYIVPGYLTQAGGSRHDHDLPQSPMLEIA